MKLAELVYEAVKDSIQFPSGFNFTSFINGDFDDDRDFSEQISFVFNYINLAFSRLFTSKKTKLKVVKKYAEDSGYLEFTDGEIISIVNNLAPDYERVKFKPFSDGVAVEKGYIGVVFYVEYRPFIPFFDIDDIREQTLDDDNEEIYEEVEVDLEDYGITDEMCAYVKEYVKGGLTEYLSPELSQRHTSLAESYFSNLKTRYTDFPQRKIEKTFNGGGAW